MLNIDSELLAAADKTEAKLTDIFAAIDRVTAHNARRVLEAFIAERVSESHFAPTTGYGYNDRGRDTLDRVFARSLGYEDALVRHTFASGTHAIATALFGVLRPGDRLLGLTGAPYDTLQGVLAGSPGSLAEFGIEYIEGMDKLSDPQVKMVHIQRSRGYSQRASLTVDEIDALIAQVKTKRPDVVCFVDNCYGEFVEEREPAADITAGSLIKNPGGGIADNGGYIAGRADLVELCAARMTVPGIGREVGATLGHNRTLFMGLYHAPHAVGEALKTAAFAAALFASFGYNVSPTANEKRGDIVQSILLGSPEKLIAFCQGLQAGSPVDSFVSPQPWAMPGYDHEVIMAAGTFTMGASIELSADAPLREPYTVYLQGGLHYEPAKWGMLSAAGEMKKRGLL